MNPRSTFASSVALTLFVLTGCSSSSSKDASSAQDGGAGDDSATEYTVLVTGPLAATTESQAQTQQDAVVTADKTQAQAAGDVGHAALLNMDPVSGSGDGGSDAGSGPLVFLAIDRWTSLIGLQGFYGNTQVQTALDGLFAAPPPTTTIAVPRPGWATWGSTSDITSDPTVFAITIRGHFQGTEEQGEAAHNQLVANVPSPGPVALGNIGHMPLANQADATELIIVEVWNNEANQEALYSAPSFVAALGQFWAGQPTITRWRSTPFAQW